MKIYIVCKGRYSDKHICAVTEDKEIAEKLEHYYTDEWDEAYMQEWDTCSVVPTPIIEYWFLFNSFGDLIDEVRDEIKSEVEAIGDRPSVEVFDRQLYEDEFCLEICVREADRDKAFKIACDVRAQTLAERMGL